MTTGNSPSHISPGVILPAVGGASPLPFSSLLLFALTTWTITFLIDSLLPLENISWSTLSSSCTLTGGEGGTYHGAESWVIRALLKVVQGYLVFFHLQKCRSFNALEKQHCEGPTLAGERRTGSALGRTNVQFWVSQRRTPFAVGIQSSSCTSPSRDHPMGSSSCGAGVLTSLFSCNSGKVFALPCFQENTGEDWMQQGELVLLLLQVGGSGHRPP